MPILRLVTAAASGTPNRAAEGTEDSEEAKAPKASSIPITAKQCLQLMVNQQNRRVQSGDIPSYQQIAFLYVVTKSSLYKQINGHNYTSGVRPKFLIS